jgi:two-component system phosphate regulon sensor histidine kinase PhoR
MNQKPRGVSLAPSIVRGDYKVLLPVVVHCVIIGVSYLLAASSPLIMGGIISIFSYLYFTFGLQKRTRGNSKDSQCTTTTPAAPHTSAPSDLQLNLLREQLQEALQKRDERDAVLASMIEGVVAVNRDFSLLSINDSAKRLLHLTEDEMPFGTPLREVVQDNAFYELVEKVISTHVNIKQEIQLEDSQNTLLYVHGTPLRDKAHHGNGAVIVFHDVTHIRRLETIRKDFVANVSHELKTPITSIKGFVETLLDGALANREDAERFLAIVSRQADRLSAIIEDLLSLSRLEQQGSNHGLKRSGIRVAELFDRCYQACLFKLDEKNIRVKIHCEKSLTVNVNIHLMEQALINLLSNAIKYSSANTEVLLEARNHGHTVSFAVSDSGIGIPEKELPRIFERFYRVDRARSRHMGGTGLGLAIVKHIAQVHGGSVQVESELTKGSRFEIVLPLALQETNASASHAAIS